MTIVLLNSKNLAFAANSWHYHALRLSGESKEVYLDSVDALRNTKNLDAKILSAILSSNSIRRALALDVITALNTHHLYAPLLRLLHKDQTGQIHLTLSLIASTAEKNNLMSTFLYRLESKNSHPTGRIAILNIFEHYNVVLSETFLSKLLQDSIPEIRLAVMNYIRNALINNFYPKKYALLQKGLSSQPYQVRLHTLFIIKDLIEKRILNPSALDLIKSCSKDSSIDVRNTCLDIKNKGKLKLSSKSKKKINFGESQTNFFKIGIFFGYKDARPSSFVSDIYERSNLANQLTSACNNREQQLCGFVRAADDMEIFKKELKNKKVHIFLLNSATSTNDDINRNNALQKWKSNHIKQKFLRALQLYNSVFYIGHSRNGWGPDFSPPKIIHENQYTDYSQYKKKKSLELMLLYLKKRSHSKPITLGLFSCASKRLFEKKLKSKLHPSSKLFVTNGLQHSASTLLQLKYALASSLKKIFSK